MGGMAFKKRTKDSVFYVEGRPSEGGRNALVACQFDEEEVWEGKKKVMDVTPEDVNVRTRVHEYGGGALKILDDLVVFVDFKTQRVYSLKDPTGQEGGTLTALTPEVDGSKLRFADFALDSRRERLVCVMEDHRGGGKEPENSLVAIKLDGSCEEPVQLASGADFYSSPALDAAGERLAFVCWDHPHMPWDVTSIMMVDFEEDGLTDQAKKPSLVAGGLGKEEAPQQPQFMPDGRLCFISDQGKGWWNLFALGLDGETTSLCPMEGCEFGGPPWGLGSKSYHIISDDLILCSYSNVDKPSKTLALLTPSTGKLEEIPIPYQTFGSVDVREDGRLGLIGYSTSKPAEVAVQDSNGEWKVVKKASAENLSEDYISTPKVLKYPSEGGRYSYMYLYLPKNADFEGLEGEKPPLLVKTHGGPTAATSSAYSPMIQYWTTRGFAVADINYGGSTGYGRKYRELLKGAWGIVDVEDAAAAATYLADEGIVDRTKMAIDGGSAGGYTTLACLAFTDVFTAGCSLYGVASLEALATDTHKFESRYLDYLVGPYPEMQDVYKQRAPIENLDKLSAPLCLFQGLEDKIVPPNQAQLMYDACCEKSIPAALEMFEGEQHGFRKEENIRRALDGEYSFYTQVWSLEAAGLPEGFVPVEIANLPNKE